MTGTEPITATSLDTPLPEDAVVSGHIFREAGLDVLSPLSWSIVGAGVERGLRCVSEQLGMGVATAAPEMTAYLGFRPYHRVDAVERMAARVAGLGRDDCWTMSFGGPPPLGLDGAARAGRGRRLNGAVRDVAVLYRTRRWSGQAAAAVHLAEQQTTAGIAGESAWSMGSAVAASISAGREAWAAHAALSWSLLVAASRLRRALELELGDHGSADVMHTVVRRPSTGALPFPVAGDPSGAPRMWSYEVADGTDLFGRWVQPVPEGAMGVARPGLDGDVHDVIPRGLPTRRLLVQLVGLVSTLVSDREAAEVVGLRALHCLRTLLDAGALGRRRNEAALLSPHELRTLDADARSSVASERADELGRVAPNSVVRDHRVRSGRLRPLPRPAARLPVATGTPLAPGWAEGLLTTSPTGAAEVVVVRSVVDARALVRATPAGVVSELGGLLSPAAIACRELGIPLVAGVRLDTEATPSVVRVDGWTGTVTLTPARSGSRSDVAP